jgi:hypothetical protein
MIDYPISSALDEVCLKVHKIIKSGENLYCAVSRIKDSYCLCETLVIGNDDRTKFFKFQLETTCSYQHAVEVLQKLRKHVTLLEAKNSGKPEPKKLMVTHVPLTTS